MNPREQLDKAKCCAMLSINPEGFLFSLNMSYIRYEFSYVAKNLPREVFLIVFTPVPMLSYQYTDPR